jgi:hypothetical protein
MLLGFVDNVIPDACVCVESLGHTMENLYEVKANCGKY